MSKLQLAAIMAPATQDCWWYYGQTLANVAQLLTQNKAMPTSINAYVDGNGVKLTVVMEPATTPYWWWVGITAEQVGQFLTQNKAQLTDISAYIDTDNQLKFAVIMTPAAEASWWYFGQTAAQVGQLLTQNKAMLTAISAYVDTDNSVKLAVVMEPATKPYWWWVGITAAQVGQFLTQNAALLTDISAYIDTDNQLKFAVIMTPAALEASSPLGPLATVRWWYFGDPGYIGQQLTQNKACMVAVSPYLLSTTNSITVDTFPNISGLNGTANLTINESGAYSFSGGWSPSNFFTGLAQQTVAYTIAIRDIRGKLFIFTTSGTVPPGGSYNFNYNSTDSKLAEDWQFLSVGYTWHDNYSANLDLGSELGNFVQSVVNWFNQNQQTIDNVIQVVGDVAGVVTTIAAAA